MTGILDSRAATNIITKSLMNALRLKIDRPSKLVIVTANGSKVRSLGEITNFPMEFAGLRFATNVQVLDSPDKVLILGNDWLIKTQAVIDWGKRTISVVINNRKRCTPISLTKVTPFRTEESSDEETSDSEYEDESLDETVIFYSDLSENKETWLLLSEDELRQELEHNPWEEYPAFEGNPAVFLASVASAEEKPQLNHGPLTKLIK